jgi:hypothetical protein
MSDQDLYDDLACYTLSHPDSSFLHQHIVDAYAAQHVDEETKPIQTVFALIGLYLSTEKGFTGRQVQRAHMQLAKARKPWPRFTPPRTPGAITVADVVAAPPGKERDAMIRRWCLSAWEAWAESHDRVRALVKAELDIG